MYAVRMEVYNDKKSGIGVYLITSGPERRADGYTWFQGKELMPARPGWSRVCSAAVWKKLPAAKPVAIASFTIVAVFDELNAGHIPPEAQKDIREHRVWGLMSH
jgi:hypothetical protein